MYLSKYPMANSSLSRVPRAAENRQCLVLIAGLDAPSTGSIEIDGEDVTAMGEDDLAHLRSEKIGFVFQSFHLIPSLTAYENILIPMEIRGLPDAQSSCRDLIEAVDLGNRGHHYPAELSGGEQQRVAIARAFANRPSILAGGRADRKSGFKKWQAHF